MSRRIVLGIVIAVLLLCGSHAAGSECAEQVAELVSPDWTEANSFGEHVAMSGDVLVATAGFSLPGAAYVFRRHGSEWQFEQKLVSPESSYADGFGTAVAISGNVIVVGSSVDDSACPGTPACNSGTAFVFRYDGSTWALEQELGPSIAQEMAYFGTSVAVSGDVAVVGANGMDDNGEFSGAAFVFRFNGADWDLEQELLAADGSAGQQFGHAVATAGDAILVGADDDEDNGVCCAGAAYVFRYNGTTWAQEQKLLASDGSAHAYFGAAVALSDDMALIGAYGDTWACPDDGFCHAGSAYLFHFNGAVWQEEQKLIAADGQENDYFGGAVSLASDVAVIGARYAGDGGSVYVFHYDGSDWGQQSKLLPDGTNGEGFGAAVGADGETAVVGSPYADDLGASTGGVHVFDLTVATPVITQAPLSQSALAGQAVTLTAEVCSRDAVSYQWRKDGVAIMDGGGISGSETPALEITSTNAATNGSYDLIVSNSHGSTVSLAATLSVDPCIEDLGKNLPGNGAASAQFGYSVATAGDVAVVGAPFLENKGAAYVFRFDGSAWVQEQQLLAADGASGDEFGISVAAGRNTVVVGAWKDDDHGTSSGAAYVFEFDGTTWNQDQKLAPADGAAGDGFGSSLALSGGVLVIGASKDDDAGADDGSAYIYAFDGSAWVQAQKLFPEVERLHADGDNFGVSVATWGDLTVIGAYHSDDESAEYVGSAYVFRFDGAEWVQEQKLLAPDGAAHDEFGQSVAVADDAIVVGAPKDDELCPPSDGCLGSTAYAFRFDGSSWNLTQALAPAGYFSGGGTKRISLAAGPGVLAIGVYEHFWAGPVYVYRSYGAEWQGPVTLQPSGFLSTDWLGYSVACAGDYLIVGAPQDDDLGSNSGSIYTYVLAPSGVAITAQPADTAIVSGQAAILRVAACGPGVLSYQWRRNGDVLSDGDGVLGASTGTLVIDPASGSDSATYDVIVSWGAESIVSEPAVLGVDPCMAQVAELSSAGPRQGFGSAVAISGDGAVVGTYIDSGFFLQPPPAGAYVYRFEGPAWTLEQYLPPPPGSSLFARFGSAVSISGDVALIGAYGASNNGVTTGAVYAFHFDGAIWIAGDTLAATDGEQGEAFGATVALDGTVAVIGAPGENAQGTNTGAAYIFRLDGAHWIQEQKLVRPAATSHDSFGTTVAVSGDVAVIGAPDTDGPCALLGCDFGSAYVFHFDGSEWNLEAELVSSDIDYKDHFGKSVAVRGNVIAVGAIGDDDLGSGCGAAYVFRSRGSTWFQEQKLLAADGMFGEFFGDTVAVDGDALVVGKRCATGACLYDSSVGAGAAYTFRYDGMSWSQTKRLLPVESEVGDGFGRSVALDRSRALIGAPRLDVFEGVGSAYLIELEGGRPVVEQQPVGQTVAFGQPATLTVQATAADAYQWRKDGVALSDGGPVSGTTTPVLTINPTAFSDTGSYDVVISNQCGSVISEPAVLTVVVPVEIIAANPPADNPFIAGQQPFRDVLQTGTSATAVTQGIGAPGTPAEGGVTYSSVAVTFAGTPTYAPSPANIVVTCSGGRPGCPSVGQVLGSGAGPYVVGLSHAIPPGGCTTIAFTTAGPGQWVRYEYLPGDVNYNGAVSTTDVLDLLIAMNSGLGALPSNRPRYDINRSGGVDVQDVLRLVQLLNGVQTVRAFAGATVAPCP